MSAIKRFIARFYQQVMNSQRDAIFAAVIFSLLPMFGWLGASIMALVTLRHGAKQGLVILFWMGLATGILALFGWHDQFLYGFVFGSLIIWMLASVLAQTNSWNKVLQTAMLLGMLGVMLTHILVPNIHHYWYQLFAQYYFDADSIVSLPMSKAQMQELFKQIALIWTGVQASVFLLSNIGTLIIARWVQSMLYNPGGFGEEFLKLRMGRLTNLILLGLIALSFTGYSVFWDMLPIPLVAFFVAGLSLIHAMVQHSKRQVLWLILFYMLLVLLFQYIMPAIVLLAITDSFIDIRKRLNLAG